MERFFHKKSAERIDFVDTTKPVQVEITDTNSPGTGGWNDNDPDGLNPNDDSIVTTQSIIQDKDKDTKVDTEESTDEDKIRFDTGGRERFRMDANDTNGGALYIKEGSGTTAPGTPSSGEGVLYEKNDGKMYFKNDAGTEYDLTATSSGMSKFILKANSGSNQDIEDEYIVWIKNGTGITTTVAAEIASDPTRSVTIDCDLEGTELKSTGETGGSKFLREDGDGTCSWQTASGGGGMTSWTLTADSGSNQTIADGNTVDIEGGTNITTAVSATDKVTINCDLSAAGTVQGTDGTYDIEAANDGSTDGNARGENSVDLCTERSSAAMVASGTNAGIIAGEDNTASGNHSFIGGGEDNTASSTHTLAAGSNNTANANFSTAFGKYGKTKRPGTINLGGGDGSTFTSGEAQSGQAIFSGRTTNASATELFLQNDGSSRFVLDSDSLVTFHMWVTAVDEAAPATINAGALFVGTIVNDSGTTAIAGAGSITKTANPSTAFAVGGADVNVTADNSNNSIKVTVEGITSKNIRWVVSMRYTEVAI